MQKTNFIFFFTLFVILGCHSDPVPPNIIIILADDMGYSDIGCYGSEIATPNLDGLAENGLRFNRFYNNSRCCPTRASLLTGLYPHRAGIGKMVVSAGKEGREGPYQGYLSRKAVTIAEALKSSGYKSYMSGKWHVGESVENWPLQRGFDRYFGLISGASSYFELIKDQPRLRQMVLDDQDWEPPEEEYYLTDAITEHAVDWINHHNNNFESPFFLYVAYTAPHWPLHALPEDIAKYKNRYDAGWDSLRVNRYRNLIKFGLIDDKTKLSNRPASVPAWNSVENKEDWSQRMSVYAAMIDRMDQGIGRIMDKLKIEGQIDNTLIIFLSDNGGSDENIESRGLNNPAVELGMKGSYVAYREPWAFLSNTPFRYYKKCIYEGGITSPFIAHWPKGMKQKGAIINQTAIVTDFLPTILDMANVDYPTEYNGNLIRSSDGMSLLPVLMNGKPMDRGPLFWEHVGNKGVRDGKWKLVAHVGDEWELYNIEEDGSEMKDLAITFPETVTNLEIKYINWTKDVGIHENE